MYGEVNTPFYLIRDMLKNIPEYIFEDSYKKWLDPACGCGYFMMVLFKKLMESLKNKIINTERRKKHIIEKMLYMVEINPINVIVLRDMFGENANILQGDFLLVNSNQEKYPDFTLSTMDVVIGNPPYNVGGGIKVPTNTKHLKKTDGITIWPRFIRKSIELLNNTGLLLMIVPSIWMKPDKAGIYDLLCKYKLHLIKTFSNTNTASIFKRHAQTPTCYFLMEKTKNDFFVSLYNKNIQRFKLYNYILNDPIPLCGSSVITKMHIFIKACGSLDVYKSNMPRKHIHISKVKDEEHMYKNVRTCRLNGLTPELIYEYSNVPCVFYGIKKLIMAHKMYGFPYFDISGEYGISNRDNYIIHNKTDEEFIKIGRFLSTKTALYIYETTRYRMKFLEKYAFDFIPNICNISDFPEEINDETIATFFGFSKSETKEIEELHKKEYEYYM